MMGCESWGASLGRYLDGALHAADVARLEAHLKTCPECAADALARRELQLAIRDAGASFRPSAAFRARVERAARRGAPGGSRPGRLYLLPIAAALLVGLGLLGLRGARERGGDLALREAVDLHVTQLGSTSPLDVLSTDSHTVKPWFEGRVPFTFELPDLAGSAFTLLGGHVAWVDGQPAAHLIFGVRKHRVSVFLLDERHAGTAAVRDVGQGGTERTFRVRSFAAGGLRYVIVSDTGAGDVEELARRLRSAA